MLLSYVLFPLRCSLSLSGYSLFNFISLNSFNFCSCLNSTFVVIYNDWNDVENINIKADFRFVPSQWEMALLCNDVSHWLGASLESTLNMQCKKDITTVHKQWSCVFHALIHRDSGLWSILHKAISPVCVQSNGKSEDCVYGKWEYKAFKST